MSIKTENRKGRAGNKAGKALRRASQAVVAFRRACLDNGEELKGLDDTRITLVEKMDEYAGYLESVFPDGGRHAQPSDTHTV